MKTPNYVLASMALIVASAFVFFALQQTNQRSNLAVANQEAHSTASEAINRANTSQSVVDSSSPHPASSALKPESLPIAWTNLPATAKIIKQVSNAIPSGSRVEALVQNGEEYFELSPNQVGEFDQIRVAPLSTLHVSMAYPNVDPGEVINLEIEDGGTINGKGFATVVKLGNDHQIHFDFSVNQEDGVYRVEARSRGDRKMLNVWVDPKS